MGEVSSAGHNAKMEHAERCATYLDNPERLRRHLLRLGGAAGQQGNQPLVDLHLELGVPLRQHLQQEPRALLSLFRLRLRQTFCHGSYACNRAQGLQNKVWMFDSSVLVVRDLFHVAQWTQSRRCFALTKLLWHCPVSLTRTRLVQMKVNMSLSCRNAWVDLNAKKSQYCQCSKPSCQHQKRTIWQCTELQKCMRTT